jgi:hypothetical protein
MSAKEEARLKLTKLQVQVDSIQPRSPSGERCETGHCRQSTHSTPRQYNREENSAVSKRHSFEHMMAVPGKLDFTRPVRSLDQLYVQASCLHPILLHKAKAWALMSKGMFQSAVTGEYLALTSECCEIKHASQRFKFAKLKSCARAIEKVVRSYGQARVRICTICIKTSPGHSQINASALHRMSLCLLIYADRA